MRARAASKRRTQNVTPHALGDQRCDMPPIQGDRAETVPVRCKLCFMCHKRFGPVPGVLLGGRGAALCRGVTGDTAVEGCPDFEHAVEPLPRATTDADPHEHEHDENQHRDREYKRCFWRHRKSAHGHHTHRTTNNFRARWAEVSLVQPIERGVT